MRRTKNAAARNAALLAVVAGVSVAVGTSYFRTKPQAPRSTVTSSPAPGTDSADAPAAIMPVIPSQQAGDAGTEVDRKELFILKVATNDNGSFLEKQSLPLDSTGTSSNASKAERALNAMADQGEDSPLPDGTRVTSVTFDKDLATVDFNDAFKKNFDGGDENEALTLNAVLATVGQFPGVKQVQILVEGKKIDSLGGNQSLEEPLPIPNTLSLAQSGH